MAATAFPDRKKHHQAPRMAPVILLRHLGKRKRKGGEGGCLISVLLSPGYFGGEGAQLVLALGDG
jgi:hypothetical protein